MKVEALTRVEHNGLRNVGDVFEVSDKQGDELIRKKLAKKVTEQKQTKKAK